VIGIMVCGGMIIFIDESGRFISGDGFSVACGLSLPHRSAGPARREIAHVSKTWPRRNGELKAGDVAPVHLAALVDVLFRHDATLHCTALDVSSENAEELEEHKRGQCEGITQYLVPTQPVSLVESIWNLRRALERMPQQLYLQSVVMLDLLWEIAEQTTMYFAQRRPRELGRYEWVVDAKDPVRITPQEKWWRDVIGPLGESRTRRQPLKMARFPPCDYRFFEASFSMKKEMWYPDQPGRLVDGFDIKKLMSDNVTFTDSRSELLLQATDVLTGFMRRTLSGKVAHDDVLTRLGRLTIPRRQEKGAAVQSVSLLSLSSSRRPPSENLQATIKKMASVGRTMIRPNRDRRAAFGRQARREGRGHG
jgi:hypothetical protein